MNKKVEKTPDNSGSQTPNGQSCVSDVSNHETDTDPKQNELTTNQLEHLPPSASILTTLNVERAKNVIELFGRISIGLIAFGYILGLLVVNIHLNKYGAYSLGLFRLNYITAGLWALFPVLLTLLFFLILFVAVFFYKSVGKSEKPFWIFGTVFLIFFLCFSPFYISTQLDMDLLQKDWAITFATGFLVSSYCVLLPRALRRTKRTNAGIIMSTGTAIIGMGALFLHVSIFAYSVYSLIPAHVGGGASRKVRLVVEIESSLKTILTDHGIRFRENPTGPEEDKANTSEKGQENIDKSSNVEVTDQKYNVQTEVIDLILLTEEDYLLLGNKGAVSMPKDNVKAVIYEK